MQREFFKFTPLFLRKWLSIYPESSWKRADNAT